jgi:hypothetical protein
MRLRLECRPVSRVLDARIAALEAAAEFDPLDWLTVSELEQLEQALGPVEDLWRELHRRAVARAMAAPDELE